MKAGTYSKEFVKSFLLSFITFIGLGIGLLSMIFFFTKPDIIIFILSILMIFFGLFAFTILMRDRD